MQRFALCLVATAMFAATASWGMDEPSGADKQTEPFVPVAPTESIHFAMRQNVELIGDWLAGKDLLSAAETAEGLAILAHVYQLQGTNDEWAQRTGKLRETIEQLKRNARAKDANGSQKALDECGRLLEQLAKGQAPKKIAAAASRGRPTASTKAVMKLMDGTYSDAKSARSTTELQHLAFTVAETANVAAHLRSDLRWRAAADEVRDAAVDVARSTPEKGLQVARAELKNVYRRCEACHQAYKR